MPPFIPSQMGYTYVQPYGGPNIYPPFMETIPQIYNNYNISTNGPIDNHSKLNMIYEDILPSIKHNNWTLLSLGERITQLNYMRSIFFQSGDSSDIKLSNGYSLLERLKFLELNPYNSYKFSSNPYRELPEGFLIYRSCYPIKHNLPVSSTMCAPNSIGLNIRIYKLTENAYSSNKTQNQSIYNQWRDITYYEYIREIIIKHKICPNFVMMYGYYISMKSDIDFIKLDNLSHNILKQNILKQNIVSINDITKTIDSDTYKGKAIVSMTESPNYSIISWASLTRQNEGNISRIINTGFHSDDIWFSILFQLMVALYVLQLHKIVINDFSLDKNVFIKDLTSGGPTTNYWKYIINGVEYYIPNYGFLLMIDSNYIDFTDSSSSNKSNKPKIDGYIFTNNNIDYTIDTFNMFKFAFDPNNFTNNFLNNGGTKLPDNIIKLFSEISLKFPNIISSNNIENNIKNNIDYYLENFMNMFVNNRIGTHLKTQEILNIKRDATGNFKKGDILVYETSHEQFIFVLFIEHNINICTILTRESPEKPIIIKQGINMGLLYKYMNTEPIIQNFKIGDVIFNEENLLETYSIFKN